METQELVKLLNDVDGQQNLYEKAKAGEGQAMLDFVRLSVLRKVFAESQLPTDEEKIKLYEALMSVVKLEAEDLKQNG